MKDDVQIIQQTKKWIDQFILKYSICPFAEKPVRNNKIHYRVDRGADIENNLLALVAYFQYILSMPTSRLSNAFIIFPEWQSDFQLFLDSFDYACLLLEDMKLDGELQLVPFHPLFQFAGEKYDDPSNYTNRSPYPMIHVLRVPEVAEAIDNHQEIAKVPDNNKKLLRDLTVNEINELKGLLDIVD